MTFLAHLPAALSCWILAAHFLRRGQAGPALALALFPLLLLLRRAWVRRVAQATMAGAIWAWADAAAGLIGMRAAQGLPWLRLALIMGAVMALAALGAAALESAPARRRANNDPASDSASGPAFGLPSAAAFCLTLGILGMIQARVALPMLLLERFWPTGGWLEAAALATYAAELVRAMRSPQAAPRWRLRLWALFSVFFFAQLAMGLAGFGDFLMTGRLHLPVPALVLAGPLYRGHGLFMLVLFVSTVAVVGPAWCSHLCYVGAWDGLAARAGRRPMPLPAWRQPARLVLAALILGAAPALRLAGVGPTVAAWLAAGFGLAGVAIMVTASRGTGAMVHCTVWCPLGAVATLLGRLHPLKVRMDHRCTGCGVCSNACRYDALRPEDIEARRPGPSCTLCGDCVGACPHTALGYRFPGLSHTTARTLFLVLAVSLHAVFLGVARI